MIIPRNWGNIDSEFRLSDSNRFLSCYPYNGSIPKPIREILTNKLPEQFKNLETWLSNQELLRKQLNKAYKFSDTKISLPFTGQKLNHDQKKSIKPW